MLYTREKLLELLERYLNLATKGHERLSEVAQAQRVQIETLEALLTNKPKEEQAQLAAILDGFIQAQTKLLDELEGSHEKVQHLQGDLLKAQEENRLDPLTHIFNRKKLEEDVDRFIANPPGNQLGLYMLVIDADEFKKINDKHGHLAGDKVLLYLVRAFRSVLQESSQLYRYGGEEFITLCVHPSHKEAIELAQRIRQKVADSQMIYQNKPIELTVSIGATNLAEEDNFESFFTRADKAMLEAKESGRNRVIGQFV